MIQPPHIMTSVTLLVVVARPHRHGERGVILHARSARHAPRTGVPSQFFLPIPWLNLS